MKSNKGLIIGSTGLTIIIVLCVITLSGSFKWVKNEGTNFEFFVFDHISANVNETISFKAQDIQNIEITSSDGDITIVPGNSDLILVDLEKTGWGGAQAEALDKAQSLEITSKVVNDTLYLTYNRPRNFYIFTYQGGSNKIDMTIHIPPNIPVKAILEEGDIYAKDIENSIELEGRFGDISLTNITGEIKANSRDGDITISDAQAGEKDINIHSEFGDIEATRIQGGATYISTRNGKIKLTDMSSSDNLDLSSESGNISLKDFDCRNLTISARDGTSDLQTGKVSGELFINAQFGNIEIENVEADSYTFEARDSNIDLDNINGSVTANVKFGDIDIKNGTNITLSISMEDGSFNFSGSLNTTSNQNIKTRFGDVILTIPDNSNFSLSVETRYGEFTSEIPINITIGPDSPTNKDKQFEKWEGQMNGGGSLLSITTQDGDITFKSLENK